MAATVNVFYALCTLIWVLAPGPSLGSMSAGSLFTFAPMAPFWTAAAILLPGAVLWMVWWGPTRIGEMAAGASTKI